MRLDGRQLTGPELDQVEDADCGDGVEAILAVRDAARPRISISQISGVGRRWARESAAPTCE